MRSFSGSLSMDEDNQVELNLEETTDPELPQPVEKMEKVKKMEKGRICAC